MLMSGSIIGSATQVMLASMHQFRKDLNKKDFCAGGSCDSITCVALPISESRFSDFTPLKSKFATAPVGEQPNTKPGSEGRRILKSQINYLTDTSQPQATIALSQL
jgi:hypothetical protein